MIKKLRLIRNFVTGFSKGYAFVEYHNKEDAFRAYKNGNKKPLGNAREIYVDIVRAGRQPNFKPRRLGGGYGGRIKSSQMRFGGRDKPFF